MLADYIITTVEAALVAKVDKMVLVATMVAAVQDLIILVIHHQAALRQAVLGMLECYTQAQVDNIHQQEQ